MPLVFLERFPWPSLQTYTALSAVLLAGTLLSAYTAVTETEAPAAEETASSSTAHSKVEQADSERNVLSDMLLYLISDSLFVWVRTPTHFLKLTPYLLLYEQENERGVPHVVFRSW